MRYVIRETMRAGEQAFDDLPAKLAELTQRGIAAEQCYICDTDNCEAGGPGEGVTLLLQSDRDLIEEQSYRVWLADHRRQDPHCTCNDCIAAHDAEQEQALATTAATIILRALADFTTEEPSMASCWLLNAALHLEGRHPVIPTSILSGPGRDDVERAVEALGITQEPTPPAVPLCEPCQKFFARFRCAAHTHGECDCPKCQGYCRCIEVDGFGAEGGA